MAPHLKMAPTTDYKSKPNCLSQKAMSFMKVTQSHLSKYLIFLINPNSFTFPKRSIFPPWTNCAPT